MKLINACLSSIEIQKKNCYLKVDVLVRFPCNFIRFNIDRYLESINKILLHGNSCV